MYFNVLYSLVVLRLVVLSTNTHDPDLRSESCLYLESTATRRTTTEDNSNDAWDQNSKDAAKHTLKHTLNIH